MTRIIPLLLEHKEPQVEVTHHLARVPQFSVPIRPTQTKRRNRTALVTLPNAGENILVDLTYVEIYNKT